MTSLVPPPSMSMLVGFCGIDMTYEDVPCRNLFRGCVIDSTYLALHNMLSRNSNRNLGPIAALHKKDPPAADRGGSIQVRSKRRYSVSAMLTDRTGVSTFGPQCSVPRRGYFPFST